MYKGILNDPSISPNPKLPVAIKEMQKDVYVTNDDTNEAIIKIYEFQHEMLVMRFVIYIILFCWSNTFFAAK